MEIISDFNKGQHWEKILGQELNFGLGVKQVKLILSQQREIRSSLELSEAVEAEIIA